MEGCADTLSQIHLLVEDELDGENARRLSRHLETCEDCSAKFDDFREIKILGEETLAAELGTVDVADGVRIRIIAFEEKQSRSRSLIRRAGIPLAAAAAIALFIIAYVVFGPTTPEPGSIAAKMSLVSVAGGTWEPSETENVVKMTKVSTDAAERRAMRLESGVIVLLNENTILEVQSADLLRLLKGDIYIDTAGLKADAAKGDGVLLRVQTDQATTVVTGTRFGVSAEEGETSVAVEEGTVTVEGDWGAQEVTGGNIFRVIESAKPKAPAPVDIDRKFSWAKERAHVAKMIVNPSGSERTVTKPLDTKGNKSPFAHRREVPLAAKEDVEGTTQRPEKSASIPQASDYSKAELSEEMRKLLVQSVAFEYECEPLREVLQFLTTISGIDLQVDDNVFEQLGKYEDCYGKPVAEKEVFITANVSEVPLETALYGMLRQYGLGYSIEGDHIYISARSRSLEWEPQAVSIQEQAKAKENVLKKLSQPVAFEFECEPFRDIIRFLKYTTGVNMFIDQAVFEQFGSYQDCYGHLVDRREVFVSIGVSELPLEAALDAIVRQNGLAYSVEPGYIYIDLQGNLPDSRVQAQSIDDQSRIIEATRDELRTPLSWGMDFECESLRDILRFLTTMTGVNIIIDDRIFEEFGTDKDCYGNPTDRRDIFITYQAQELTLESALHDILESHNLKYTVEPGYVYITSKNDLPERSMSEPSVGKRRKIGEEIREALQEPIAFGFECEPLRSAVRFFTSRTGVNIFVDQDVFDELGTNKDCNGAPMQQEDILITYPASKLPFEIALNAILKPHGLGFSVAHSYLYISKTEKLKAEAAGAIAPIRRFEHWIGPEMVLTEETEWPKIEVKNVFDLTNSGYFVSILAIDDKRMFVKEGDSFGSCEIRRIDGATNCVTIGKLERDSIWEERKFCKEETQSGRTAPSGEIYQTVEDDSQPIEATGWPQILVLSIFDPNRDGKFIAILEINHRRKFAKTGERIRQYKILSIDGITNCVTLVNDQGEEREFCTE